MEKKKELNETSIDRELQRMEMPAIWQMHMTWRNIAK